jgi:hypothetical protein
VIVPQSGVKVSHVIIVIKPSLVLHLLGLVWLGLVLLLGRRLLLLVDNDSRLLLQLVARGVGRDASYSSHVLLIIELQHVQLVLSMRKLVLKFSSSDYVRLEDRLLYVGVVLHLVDSFSVSVKNCFLTQV